MIGIGLLMLALVCALVIDGSPAIVITDEPATTARCLYCGGPAVISGRCPGCGADRR